jgi:hypothetical protein
MWSFPKVQCGELAPIEEFNVTALKGSGAFNRWGSAGLTPIILGVRRLKLGGSKFKASPGK